MLSKFQSNFDPIIFFMNLIGIVISLVLPSIFCYFANLATDRVLNIANTAYGLNWFDHPVEMQKFIVLMIARSHERIEFNGFGLVLCTLETLGKVCNILSGRTFRNNEETKREGKKNKKIRGEIQ